MKRKIKRLELILLSLWLIIILAVAGYVIIGKASVVFIDLDEGISTNQQKLVRLNAILKQEKELNSEYENVFSGYRAFNDTDSLLQEINAIAKKLNVNITNIKPASAAKEETAYRLYTIRIEGQDYVYAIAKFLNVLSEELRGVSIERLQLSAQNREELPKVSILVNALVFKQ